MEFYYRESVSLGPLCVNSRKSGAGLVDQHTSLMARKHDIHRHAEQAPMDLLIISPGERVSVQIKRWLHGCWPPHNDGLLRLVEAGPKKHNGVQPLGLIRALLAVAPGLERSRHYVSREWLEHCHLQP